MPDMTYASGLLLPTNEPTVADYAIICDRYGMSANDQDNEASIRDN
jgi:hypothetical protein